MPSNFNPFRKNNYMSASERTKRLSSKTMTIVSNSKKTKAADYNKCDNFFDKTISHSKLLNYTKGYFQIKCCCEEQTTIPKNTYQGKYTYVDLDDVVKVRTFNKKKDYYYVVDDCRHLKGIITPVGKLDPIVKKEHFDFPVPLKKLYKCCNTKINTCGPCNIHCGNTHTHYFPSSSTNVKYEHKHSTHPHPNPHPYPNTKSTNFMTKYDLDKSIVG